MNTFKLSLLIACSVAPAHGMLVLNTKTFAATQHITKALGQACTTTQKDEKKEPLKYPPYVTPSGAFLKINGVEEPEEIRAHREQHTKDTQKLLTEIQQLKTDLARLQESFDQFRSIYENNSTEQMKKGIFLPIMLKSSAD